MIPVNEPLIDGNEKNYLAQCIDTGWISSEGPFVRRFEEEFALRIGRKHAIAVSNGSAALDIAVAALDIGSRDEVIMPTFTIISCAAAIVRAGATPVLVDSDSSSWGMDVEKIEPLITSATKAIMAVHIYGLPVDMRPLERLAEKYGLRVIEDAAEAHGLTYRGRQCGTFGDVSTFSFYPNKLVTTGEGGMVLTDSDQLADRARSLRNLCFDPKRRFVHERLGWNYRMTNIQAALGLAQLERFDEFLQRKRAIGKRYNDRLVGALNDVQLPLAFTETSENGYWVYGIVLGDSVSLDAGQAIELLAKRGIDTRPFFWPMHEQPVFRKMGLFAQDRHSVAERIARRGFYVPSGMALSEHQIDAVADALVSLFG